MELQVDPKIQQNPVKEEQRPLKQENYLCETCQTTVAKEKSDYHEQYLCAKIVKFNQAQLSSKLRQQSKPISKLQQKQHSQSKHNKKFQQHTSAKLQTKPPMQQQLISSLPSIRKTNSNTYQELNEEDNVEQKPQRNMEKKPKKKKSQIRYVEKQHQDHLSQSQFKQRIMNLPISEIKKVPSKVNPSSKSSINYNSKSSRVRSNRAAAAAAPMRKQQSELKEGKVECSSCKKMIPFELIDDHEFTCSLSVECEYCGLPLIITQLQEHEKTCQIKELWEKEQHNHYSHKQQSYYQGVYDDGEGVYENDFHCEHMHHQHHHNHHNHNQHNYHNHNHNHHQHNQNHQNHINHHNHNHHQHNHHNHHHHHHNDHYDQGLEDDFEIDQWEGQNKKHKGLTHSKLGKLNFSSYKKPKNQQQSQSQQQQPCAICYMQFQHHETVIKLPCLHIFHPECVGKWLETDDRCPMCKVNVT